MEAAGSVDVTIPKTAVPADMVSSPATGLSSAASGIASCPPSFIPLVEGDATQVVETAGVTLGDDHAVGIEDETTV